MSAENPAIEGPQPSSGDEPSRLRIRKGDEWVDAPFSAREPTGDPELNDLWNMSLGEFEKILDDENHPLYEKAKVVSSEIVAPVREALYGATNVLGPAWKLGPASFFPEIDFMGPKLSLAGVFPKVALTDFMPGFSAFVKSLRRFIPPNWSEEIDIERVLSVIQGDGLPLTWVPRADVVDEVLRAADRTARVAVLLDHKVELIEDCHQVLDSIHEEILAGQLSLARKAVDALADGHDEAAQALAVVVTETAVARGISGRYEEAKKQVLFDPETVPLVRLRLRAALAPIGHFYTTWYPNSGAPAPEALSRHVTVHQADQSHYTPGNAIVAALLATSVLRAFQELEELADATHQD